MTRMAPPPRERWKSGDGVHELSSEPGDRNLDSYREEQDYGPDPYGDDTVERTEWTETCGKLPSLYDLIVGYEGSGPGSCTITAEEYRRRNEAV